MEGAKAKGVRLETAGDFAAVPGRGASADVGGKRVRIGSAAWLEEQGVDGSSLRRATDEARSRGETAVLVAVDGRAGGLLRVADPLKPGSVDAIRALRAEGLRVVLLTGDHEASARAVAREAGIDEVIAGLLPEEKGDAIRNLRAEGRVVAMAGDGINDAIALARADVGVAMGTGTDVAIESAAVTLVKGDLRGLVRARRLGRATMKNIRQNLFFAFAYNALGIPIAAGVL